MMNVWAWKILCSPSLRCWMINLWDGLSSSRVKKVHRIALHCITLYYIWMNDYKKLFSEPPQPLAFVMPWQCKQEKWERERESNWIGQVLHSSYVSSYAHGYNFKFDPSIILPRATLLAYAPRTSSSENLICKSIGILGPDLSRLITITIPTNLMRIPWWLWLTDFTVSLEPF